MQEYVLGLDCGINVGCQDPLLLLLIIVSLSYLVSKTQSRLLTSF